MITILRPGRDVCPYVSGVSDPFEYTSEDDMAFLSGVTISLQEGESFKQKGNTIKLLIERLPWPRQKQGLVHDR